MRDAFFGMAMVTMCACGWTAPPPPEPLVVPQVNAASAPIVAAADDDPPRPAEGATVPLPRAIADELVAVSAKSTEQDAVFFRQAHERQLSGDLPGARKAWYELIKGFPSSSLVPYAYLAFGDAFVTEAEGDSPDKWPLAGQAYREVLKYPPPANLAYAYAWYRLGVVLARTGESAKALDAEKKAVTAARQHPDLPLSSEIAAASWRELAVAYAASGRPEAAMAFFRSIDQTTVSDTLALLADEYVRRGATRDLLQLYSSALAASKDTALCRGSAEATKTLAAKTAADADLVAKYEPQRLAACGP